MEPTSVMATLLSSIGDIVTAAIGWMGQVLTTVTATGHELILLAFLLPFIGLGIHWLRLLTR